MTIRAMTTRAITLLVVGVIVGGAVLPQMVAAASTGVTPAPENAVQTDQSALACQPDADHPDPERDVLGWENGCWYNETISVDRTDGLDDAELDRVVGRAMARVEHIRELEFKTSIETEVTSRDDFQETVDRAYANVTEADRLHQNVKFEALFMVDERTDAIAVLQRNTGSTLGGFYSPQRNRLVIVSENTTTPKLNELTLAHELVHGLQDQHFNLSRYNRSTEELNNAVNGIVEGDPNYVEYLYEQRCDAEWNGTCLLPDASESGGGSASEVHIGVFLVGFQPYSDGPSFVERIRESSGWQGVNAVYENPPASTEQVIHVDKYGTDEPTRVRIGDRSSDDWRVLELGNGSINHASFGEAGLFVMFWYPGYETRGRTQVIPYVSLFNTKPGTDELQDLDPYTYSTGYSQGWDGDRLLPYVTDDSATTNETGYVWKLAWDSTAEAEEFVDGYESLLEARGAEPVNEYENTYRIPETSGFGDAFYYTVEGTSVIIVNAPTVDDLRKIRTGSAPRIRSQSGSTSTATPTATRTVTPTAPENGATPQTDARETRTPGQPGFGILVAIAALLALRVISNRRPGT